MTMGGRYKKPGVYQFGHLGYSVTHFKLVHRSDHLSTAGPTSKMYFGNSGSNFIVVTSNASNPVIPGTTIFCSLLLFVIKPLFFNKNIFSDYV